jgi:peroxiredoxin
MKFRLATVVTTAFAAAALLSLQTALADPPGAKVENFTLTDQSGKSHELYSLQDAPAIVIVPQVNGDPLSRDAIKTIEGMKGIFGGAEYFVLNSSPVDTSATIAAEAKTLNTAITFLDDDQQQVARNLGVSQTGEAFIINPIGWKVVYHGPVSAASAKDPAAQYLLFNALVHVMAHRIVEEPNVAVKGTPIKLGGN